MVNAGSMSLAETAGHTRRGTAAHREGDVWRNSNLVIREATEECGEVSPEGGT